MVFADTFFWLIGHELIKVNVRNVEPVSIRIKLKYCVEFFFSITTSNFIAG